MGRDRKRIAGKESYKDAANQDPWGVMVKPKYGVRRCPDCGKLIEIGRYKCP